MPYGKRSQRQYKKKAPVPRNTQKIRKLAGQKPLTWSETLARSAGPIGHLASSVATIAGLVNSESKEVDTNVLAVAISNTGAYNQYLTEIAEGDDRNQRNGRFVLAKHLQYRMQPSGDPTVQTRFSYAFVMDKKANEGLSGTPWTDVFNGLTPTAMINRDNADRFVILKRGVFAMNTGTNLTPTIKGFINLKGIHLKWNGTGATNRDRNQIFLIAISNQGVNTVSLSGDFRFEYYDN